MVTKLDRCAKWEQCTAEAKKRNLGCALGLLPGEGRTLADEGTLRTASTASYCYKEHRVPSHVTSGALNLLSGGNWKYRTLTTIVACGASIRNEPINRLAPPPPPPILIDVPQAQAMLRGVPTLQPSCPKCAAHLFAMLHSAGHTNSTNPFGLIRLHNANQLAEVLSERADDATW